MRPSLPVTFVDVFARRPREGNLLAVVHDADALPDETMRSIARRLRLAETTFLQLPSRPGVDYRLRIHTIAAEIPFAGHPSLGSAVAHAHRTGRRHAELVQLTGVGTQALTVDVDEDGDGWASMRQNDAVIGDPLELPDLAGALGLPPEAFDRRLPIRLGSTGLPTLIVPLVDVAWLGAMRVDGSRLAGLVPPMDGAAVNCYVVAHVAGERWRARCFAPDLAGGEDPATGSAVGPLVAYLREEVDVERIVVEQGVEMGEPSELEAEARDGIVVSGRVWLAGTGQLVVG